MYACIIDWLVYNICYIHPPCLFRPLRHDRPASCPSPATATFTTTTNVAISYPSPPSLTTGRAGHKAVLLASAMGRPLYAYKQSRPWPSIAGSDWAIPLLSTLSNPLTCQASMVRRPPRAKNMSHMFTILAFDPRFSSQRFKVGSFKYPDPLVYTPETKKWRPFKITGTCNL